MAKNPPDILRFVEYRKFLQERYQFLKLNDRKFSHRYINGKIGVKSSGWFGDVLSGRRSLKPTQLKSVAAVFKLSQEEQKGLRALVDLDLAKSPEDIALAYEKWYEMKGIGQETVAKNRFKFYERWYFSALRELLAIHPGRHEPEFLASALDPKITPKQAKEAMNVLAKLGFIPMGKAEPAKPLLPVLVKDAATRSQHWKRMMVSMMLLGRRALDKYNRDERNFSAVTLTFSADSLKKAGEEITALRKRLLYLSEKDKQSDRVYHCLFQIYPVSTSLEATRV